MGYDIRTVMGPATEMTSAFNTEMRMVDIKINLGGNTGDVVYVPLQAQISYPVYYQIPKQVLRARGAHRGRRRSHTQTGTQGARVQYYDWAGCAVGGTGK